MIGSITDKEMRQLAPTATLTAWDNGLIAHTRGATTSYYRSNGDGSWTCYDCRTDSDKLRNG